MAAQAPAARAHIHPSRHPLMSRHPPEPCAYCGFAVVPDGARFCPCSCRPCYCDRWCQRKAWCACTRNPRRCGIWCHRPVCNYAADNNILREHVAVAEAVDLILAFTFVPVENRARRGNRPYVRSQLNDPQPVGRSLGPWGIEASCRKKYLQEEARVS